MKKRILSMLLAVLMVLSALPFSVAAQTFADVPTDHYAYDAIEYLESNYIVTGYENGTYKPEAGVTRAELATIFSRIENKDLPTEISNLPPDVPGDTWYTSHVFVALRDGYMLVDESGNFCPNSAVTREDLMYACASFIDGYSALSSSDAAAVLRKFVGDNPIGEAYKDSVAYTLAIGFDDSEWSLPEKYSPKQEINRAILSVALYRIFTENYSKTPVIPQYHTVTFNTHEGVIIKSESVNHGESATAPSVPERPGYTFTNWDTDFSNVITDLVVTAQYEEEQRNPEEDDLAKLEAVLRAAGFSVATSVIGAETVVEVTGIVTLSSDLTFVIPENVRVLWKADLTAPGLTMYCTGLGLLEIADGTLEFSSQINEKLFYGVFCESDMIISGGKIRGINCFFTVYHGWRFTEEDNYNKFVMTGGEVVADFETEKAFVGDFDDALHLYAIYISSHGAEVKGGDIYFDGRGLPFASKNNYALGGWAVGSKKDDTGEWKESRAGGIIVSEEKPYDAPTIRAYNGIAFQANTIADIPAKINGGTFEAYGNAAIEIVGWASNVGIQSSLNISNTSITSHSNASYNSGRYDDEDAQWKFNYGGALFDNYMKDLSTSDIAITVSNSNLSLIRSFKNYSMPKYRTYPIQFDDESKSFSFVNNSTLFFVSENAVNVLSEMKDHVTVDESSAIIEWNATDSPRQGITHIANTSEYIFSHPETVVAKWEKKSDDSGIIYTNLTNEGFITLDEVNVINQYTVTFKDHDGAVLKTQTLEAGQSATAPTEPTRDGYTFVRWDKDFTNVRSNLVVTAVYEKDNVDSVLNSIEITEGAWNGNTMQLSVVGYDQYGEEIEISDPVIYEVLYVTPTTATAGVSSSGLLTFDSEVDGVIVKANVGTIVATKVIGTVETQNPPLLSGIWQNEENSLDIAQIIMIITEEQASSRYLPIRYSVKNDVEAFLSYETTYGEWLKNSQGEKGGKNDSVIDLERLLNLRGNCYQDMIYLIDKSNISKYTQYELIILVRDSESAVEFAGGNGSESSPYLISTPEQLNEVRYNWNSCFKQINDIDMTAVTLQGGKYYYEGNGWQPIGAVSGLGIPFFGKYDGDGHKIKGLNINYPNIPGDIADVGLFGYICEGEVFNLGIVNSNIALSAEAGHLGSIVGRIDKGSIKNCYNESRLSAIAQLPTQSITMGGIVGESGYTTISECYNAGQLVASKFSNTAIGGIVGAGCEVSNCYNVGGINVEQGEMSLCAGGIIGISKVRFQNGEPVSARIMNCYSTAEIVISNENKYSNIYPNNPVGGILGVPSELNGVNVEIVNSFRLYEYENVYGTLLTEAEMKNKNSFADWDFEEIWAISPNINNGYPQFKRHISSHTVTFVDYKGTVLKTEEVEHGSAATAPAVPDIEGYTFAGWDVDFANVTSDLTVTAQYEINKYTVIFKDYDGTVLKTQQVEHGENASSPANPTRVGYTFKEWDKTFTAVTKDTIVMATYTVNVYDVVFKDYDATILKEARVQHGYAAVAPQEPVRSGYTFTGWDKAFNNVTSNLTVTAQYTQNPVNEFTVVFKDYDGFVLKTQAVQTGNAATAPVNPKRAGYDFAGWDKSFDNVTADLTVTATYTVALGFEVIDEPGDYLLESMWVPQNLIILANNVTIRNGSIAGNVVAYGDNVQINNVWVAGNVSLYGKNIRVQEGTIAGNLFIGATNAYIYNMSVAGSVTIEQSVEDGDADFDKSITPIIYVRGGGMNSIRIKDSEVGEIVVDKPADAGSQPVRIATEGSTEIGNTVVSSSAIIDNTSGSSAIESVSFSSDMPTGTTVVLRGEFEEVSIASNNSTAELEGASVGTLTVEKGAENTSVVGSGEVDTARVDTTVEGSVNFANDPKTTKQTHAITATSGENGNISPSGNVSVDDGANQTFVIKADSGYKIDKITVNGQTVSASSSYTFTNVTSEQSISVSFTADSSVPLPPPSGGNPEEEPNTEEWENPFADINDGAWYYDNIKFVSENGLMNGTDKDVFNPGASINRAMFVTILYRMAGEPALEGNMGYPFADVDAKAYYGNAVYWARANGIVKGISDSTFSPAGSISREDLAVMLWRYAEYLKVEKPESAAKFADDANIADYAKEAVYALNKLGVIGGKKNNNFDPKGTAKRAEAAAMIHRFMEKVVKG